MIRPIIVRRLAKYFVILALINVPATLLYWYHLVWWFDMPMHFLGGVAVFYLAFLLWLPARKWVSANRFYFEVVITALLFGVLWEALELFLYVRFSYPAFHLTDSISDLFFDLAGVFFGVLGTLPLMKKYQS